jgi:hypothetical protein
MAACSLVSSPHPCVALRWVSAGQALAHACCWGRSPVSGCGMAVHDKTVRMVRGTGVPSRGSVVVMGTIWVTTLHPREMGKLELPLLLRLCHPRRQIPRE